MNATRFVKYFNVLDSIIPQIFVFIYSMEERIFFNRSLWIFNEAGIEKYFEPRDRKEAEERKHEKVTQPQVGDLVWVRKLQRLNKHPEEGFLMGPCLITAKPTSQQVEVLYL